MAEDRKFFILKEEGEIGAVKIAEGVLTAMVGLAATEVKGVASLAGNATYEMISKKGSKALGKGVKVNMEGDTASFELAVNIDYGYSIPEVCSQVQERVKNAVESMTGLTVGAVDVKVAGVDMSEE